MRTERGEVVERLECYLLEQQVGPGQCLPSERELCQALNVSRTALRCAIRQLTDEGTALQQGQRGHLRGGAEDTAPASDLHSL